MSLVDINNLNIFIFLVHPLFSTFLFSLSVTPISTRKRMRYEYSWHDTHESKLIYHGIAVEIFFERY